MIVHAIIIPDLFVVAWHLYWIKYIVPRPKEFEQLKNNPIGNRYFVEFSTMISRVIGTLMLEKYIAPGCMDE